MISGPIVLIEDDENNKEILYEILTELEIPNPVKWLSRPEPAIEFSASYTG